MDDSKVNWKIFTEQERAHAHEMHSELLDVVYRRTKRLGWALIGGTFLATTLWAHESMSSESVNYKPYQSVFVGLLVTIVAAFFLYVGAANVVEFVTDKRAGPRIKHWLNSINYPARLAAYDTEVAESVRKKADRQAGHHAGRTGGGGPDRTYPVTDGMYDPELYGRRGGRDTYVGMRDTGIDDYETYKNNVLEAD
jgi:hypothetical protein